MKLKTKSHEGFELLLLVILDEPKTRKLSADIHSSTVTSDLVFARKNVDHGRVSVVSGQAKP
jgi:hypothetical protein